MSFVAVLERLSKLENPYPGLRPFETSEAHLFFGRDQQVLDLLDRLARNRFVAVMGLSGSGKSSLIRAGLIPALHQGRLLEPGLRWRVATARPAGAPFARLAESLGCTAGDLRASSHGLIDYARGQLSPSEGLFVLIDQFEELFRYKDRAASASNPTGQAVAASEAAAFIDLLLASTRSPLPVYVVITMRTDYLGDCAEFPEFPEALNESQYLVTRLTRGQRRQAIEGPLGRVQISSALVERILNDAGDEPDQLPILQHALMRTWLRWRQSHTGSERAIEMGNYVGAGGFQGALNRHADELLQTPAVRAEPEFVGIIFKRLTALGRGNRERRDPAPLSELWDLCSAATDDRRQRVTGIIDVFRQGEATFLTPRDGELAPDTYIDIAHESLIRNWKVLAEEWLPEEEKQAQGLSELLDRARGWRAGKKELLMGLDLSGALEWDSQRNRSPRWAQHYAGTEAIEEVESFLAASREKFAESERREKDRSQRELRRTRLVAIFVGVAFLAATAFGAYAYFQKTNADSQRAEAKKQAGIATENASAANTERNKAEEQSRANAQLAEEANKQRTAAEQQQKLAESRELAAQVEALLSLRRPGEALDRAIRAFSVEKTSEAREAIAHAFYQELTKLPGDSAAFSPDGQRVVTANFGGPARVWNAATGKAVATLAARSIGVDNRAAFSPDGQRVVTAGFEGALVCSAVTGKVVATLADSLSVNSAAFSPDGERVVTTSLEGIARVWNAATGKAVATLVVRSVGVDNRAAFSPDGQRVVTAGNDGAALVWNAATGQVIATLVADSFILNSAVFSPDGQRVVTVSGDRVARVWNVATGQVVAELQGAAVYAVDRLNPFNAVSSAAFSPDGQRVVTASDDNTALVRNAATGRVVARMEGHSGSVNSTAFSPDGQRVVTASDDHSARVWDATTGQVIERLEGHSDRVLSAAFSPDGQRVVTVSADHTVRVWNAAAGRVFARLEGHSNDVYSAVFSPDGQRVATASADNTALVWNAATGKMIAKLQGHSLSVLSAAFSPDGQRVVTASADKTARVWNATTGQVIAKIEGHSDHVLSAAFSPDGQRVVTASDDHTARVWYTATGRVVTKFEGHSDRVLSAAFSPDGQRVVTASDDHTAQVWNAATGQVIAKLEGHSDVVWSAAFSPDGQRVVTASDDKTARVWNATTGHVIAKLEGHSDRVVSAAFSRDGQHVVTASSDKTARVWNSATGQVIAELEGHSGGVYSATFSLDGQRVVTASSDKTARVWNAATGEVIAKLEGHSGSLNSAAFSPDGQRIVTSSEDHTALIFRIVTLDDIARLLASK